MSVNPAIPCDQSRRRLLKTSALLLAAGALPALARPTVIAENPRVAALEWSAVEMLAVLGLTPVAVSDISGYRRWVSQPVLPATVSELGLRSEPNLEYLDSLRPDLLILPEHSALPLRRLQRIAPCWQYPFVTADHGPLSQARHNIVSLAQRLQRQRQATAWLAEYDQQRATQRAQLLPRAGTRVLMFSLMTPRQALVLTANSLFGEVLSEYGITCAWQGATSLWGSVIVGVEQLLSCQADIALMFSHQNDALITALADSPLWQQMPFVRDQRCYTLPPVWMYGSLPSAQRFASQLTAIMEKVDA